MASHPFASTRAALEAPIRGELEYNSLAFKYAGRCSMSPRPQSLEQLQQAKPHDWTRAGVRRCGSLRWFHLCRACWEQYLADAATRAARTEGR